MVDRYPPLPPRDLNRPYKRIAAEEAWIAPNIAARYVEEIRSGGVDDPGFHTMWGFFAGDSPQARDHSRRIQSLGEERIADMDNSGIDIQVVSLGSPGVQIFEPDEATALARDANDQLAEGIAANPDRLVGLAAFSPLDPANAAKELERGVNKLDLRGAILNSHTLGTYLDDEQYWEIFEAAESLDVPVYLHPNTPSKQMIEPFLKRGLDAAVYGFACETGLHALRLIVSGLFDRFPKLQIVLGHCGEALPYWLYRIDFMHHGIAVNNRSPGVRPLNRKPSDVLRENVWYTCSGMPWEPAITFCQHVIGQDRVMYAMDYPYQYVPDEVPMVDRLSLAPAVKKMFFEDNAVRLFKL